MKSSAHHSLLLDIALALAISALAGCASSSPVAATAGDGTPALPPAAEFQDGVAMGIFNEGAQKDLGLVHQVERQIGKRFSSVMWYQDWSSPFPAADAERVSRGGYLPHITWEPWFFGDQEKVKLSDILDGKWDSYIKEYARAIARFGKPLMLRWGHECNGNWYPWSLSANGKSPAVYVAAYRHVHDLFTKAGATNVSWIWSPNASSVPAEAWNALLAGYPGDDYVDWVALDGYNFSGSDSFRSIFASAYTKLLSSIRRPIMIGEFADGGDGEAKATWLKEMSDDLAGLFPGIKAVTWFEINKELDWRLLASPTTIAGAKAAFASDNFVVGANYFDALSDYFYGSYNYLQGQLSLLKPKVLVQELKAGHLVSAPVIDGLPDEWPAGSPLVLTGAAGPDNLSANIRLGWDADQLYVLAVVSDDQPRVNKNSAADIWNGDNLELCLSLDPAADASREFFGPADFQIGLNPGDKAAKLSASNWEWSKIKGHVKGLRLAVTEQANAWTIEAAIPWAILGSAAGLDFRPQAGLKISFDLAVDDADAKGSRESQTIWNGDASFYANPSQWGRLVLEN